VATEPGCCVGAASSASDNRQRLAVLLAGDVNGTDYLPWTPAVVTHNVPATPFAGADASGTAGTAKMLSLKVTDKRKGKP